MAAAVNMWRLFGLVIVMGVLINSMLLIGAMVVGSLRDAAQLSLITPTYDSEGNMVHTLELLDLDTQVSVSFAQYVGSGRDVNSSWSPDGRLFASANFDGIQILNIFTQDLTILPTENLSPTVRWSPDGMHLAYAAWPERDATNDLYVYTPQTGTIQNLTNTYNREEGLFAWSPDSRQLVYLNGHAEVWITTLYGTSRQLPIKMLPYDSTQLLWSPDGQSLLVYPDGNTTMHALLNIADGTLTDLSMCYSKEYVSSYIYFAWHPNGALTCTISIRNKNSTEIRMVDLASGTFKTIGMLEGEIWLEELTWSPDGQWLLYRPGRPVMEMMHYDSAAGRLSAPTSLGRRSAKWYPQ